MLRYSVLVGNGLTLDLVSSLGIDTSSPLQHFNHSKINYSNFIDHLPAIKSELMVASSLTDFDAITYYVQKNKDNPDKDCQLRRFLSISYSQLQNVVDNFEDKIKKWKWTQWFKENKKSCQLAISLNYDLALERSLYYANISYRRIGTDEPLGKVPILKPHGSIDFDLPDYAIYCPIEQRWGVTTSLNDAQYVKTIPKADWLLPRMEADLIPPSMHNIQRGLSWINEMFNIYTMQAGKINALIIVGISYWEVDRPEIDFFLRRLNSKAKIFIMNKTPNPKLLQKIESLGHAYELLGFNDLPW